MVPACQCTILLPRYTEVVGSTYVCALPTAIPQLLWLWHMAFASKGHALCHLLLVPDFNSSTLEISPFPSLSNICSNAATAAPLLVPSGPFHSAAAVQTEQHLPCCCPLSCSFYSRKLISTLCPQHSSI
jgi:hypothetical protein